MLVGGHSAEGAELALGFAVTGRTRPGRLLRKGGLRPGDRLILTKPLGTGVILAAEMRGLAPARHRRGGDRDDAAVRRRRRRACLLAHGATACTDVTGFGLLGHLLEMLPRLGGGRAARPRGDPGARRRAGAARPRRHQLAARRQSRGAGGARPMREPDPPLAALLIDPQTAGGLLAGVPAERAAACLAELRAARLPRRRDRRGRRRRAAARRASGFDAGLRRQALPDPVAAAQ